ncbi:MAG TPA: tetratricopeptide repeat protein, partial [candidate division Zixibacteria bacterium]|nr:tetratricopeptide repeat protein [candidate division Zixibacteria bacterium]
RRFSAFVANFSLELTVGAVDSQRVDINAFLATVGSRPDSRTKRFLMELELPAVIDNIRGKAGATYKLRLIPRAYTDIEVGACEYDHRDSGSFKHDPTAYFDLYYVPQSLGDYHWNKVKQLLEGDFRPFREAFDITMPGKIHYFMYPCPTPTIAWDSRFGYYIDPTRLQAHVVYNHEYMGANVLVANLTQLLRVSGYAPPFLAEGLASYFYFNDYETLLAKEQGKLLPLADLLTTWGYYSADPTLAAAQAGSFCRFLADTRGIERFRALYKESDDLTIAGQFIEQYGEPITALESAWLAHLDTLQPTRKQFLKRSGIEAAFGSPRRALDVLETALRWDGSISDTLNTMENMAPYYAELGLYDLALRTYQALFDAAPESSTNRSRYLLRVGYYNMLTGELERARENFTALAQMDSTQAPVARYNLARTALLAGDTTGALADLERMRIEKIEPLLQAEVTLTLAYIYGQPGSFADPDTAAVRFRQAYSAANYLVTNAPTQPLHRL